MRRRTSVQKHPPRRPLHRLAVLLAFALALLALYWYIEDRFEPVLDELAEYEARAAVTRAVTGAVTAEMAAHPQRYGQLYRVRYNGAEPAAVQADAAAMNEACQALTAAAEQALAALPPVRVWIPFGTLTGLSLLNGLGPGWPLCFTPQAYAEGTVRESAETVGINQTSYRAVLELRVSINMVLDGKNRVLEAVQTVPLASVLVSGETPGWYAAGG